MADVEFSLGMVWLWSSCDTVRRGFGVLFGVVAVIVGISKKSICLNISLTSFVRHLPASILRYN